MSASAPRPDRPLLPGPSPAERPVAPAPRPAPAPPRRRPEPLAGVVAVAAVGLGLTWLHHPRMGLYVLSAALGLAAAARLFLPPRHAGLLAVRSRLVDVVTLLLLAAGLVAIATVTPFPRPGG